MDGEDSGNCRRLTVEICFIIRQDIKTHNARTFALTNGWPTDIDFCALPERVMKMKDALHHLVFTEGLTSDNPVQQQFNKDIGLEYPDGKGLEKFSRQTLAPGRFMDHAQPG